MRVPRDRVRAYDVYAVAASILVGLGAISTVLALAFVSNEGAIIVAVAPFASGIGLGARLLSGWNPSDRSLDRTVPEEDLEDQEAGV